MPTATNLALLRLWLCPLVLLLPLAVLLLLGWAAGLCFHLLLLLLLPPVLLPAGR